MNHPLSVYTVIYIAILFVTISIFGGDISRATGEIKILLISLGLFSLKVAIDDYIHFCYASKFLARDLYLSLIMYLLLSSSIGFLATGQGRMASLSFFFVYFVGCIWLACSGINNTRRENMFIVNLAAMCLLVPIGLIGPSKSYEEVIIPILLLLLLIVYDFIFLSKTLNRLSDLATEQSNNQHVK